MPLKIGFWVLVGALLSVLAGLAFRPGDGTDDSEPKPKSSGFADNRPSQPAQPQKQAGGGFAADREPAGLADLKLPEVDGERALKYLKQLCDIGPRISGTPGMTKQQQLVTEHFTQLGAKVRKQEFQAKQKSQPRAVGMTNLIFSWKPEKARRVILCAHYDTRPAAHEEPNRANWNKPFLSANDGTSGVALLMELAHHIGELETPVGIDIVLFDGEEYIFQPATYYDRGDEFFFGSRHFASEYKKNLSQHPYRYEAAILLDLFAHENARLAIEGYSMQFAPNLVDTVWGIARKLGVKSFRYERGFQRGIEVLDDHVPLNEVGIPAINIIDFDYVHWHKLSDTPDKCSPKQMADVGRVVLAWLKTLK